MTRPAFLTSPGVWCRAPRTGQTAADYACAVQRTERRTRWHPAECVFIALFLTVVAALATGLL